MTGVKILTCTIYKSPIKKTWETKKEDYDIRGWHLFSHTIIDKVLSGLWSQGRIHYETYPVTVWSRNYQQGLIQLKRVPHVWSSDYRQVRTTTRTLRV